MILKDAICLKCGKIHKDIDANKPLPKCECGGELEIKPCAPKQWAESVK